ncbi:MAG: hypothetical protein AAFV53_41095 [Myxococcota bacterium]
MSIDQANAVIDDTQDKKRTANTTPVGLEDDPDPDENDHEKPQGVTPMRTRHQGQPLSIKAADPSTMDTARSWWFRMCVSADRYQTIYLEEYNACTEYTDEIEKIEQAFKERMDALANPKLKQKLWIEPGFEARLKRLKERQEGANAISNPGKKALMAKRAREDFQKLQKDMEKHLQGYIDREDTQYERQEVRFDLLTAQEAAELSAKFDQKYNVSIEEKYCLTEVMIRVSSKQSVDMKAEWDGVDRILATRKDALEPLRQEIRQHVEDAVSEINAAREEADAEDRIREILSVMEEKIQQSEAKLAGESKQVLHDVVGQAYQIKREAKVYRRIRIKKLAIGTINMGLATSRIVLSGGLDVTAYIHLARGFINATSMIFRDAMYNLGSAMKTVKQNIERMRDACKETASRLKETLKSQAKGSLELIVRLISGSSIPVVKGSLDKYISHMMMYTQKLDNLRQTLKERSLSAQSLVATSQQVLSKARENLAKARKDKQPAQVIKTLTGDLEKLQEEADGFEAQWRSIQADIREQLSAHNKFHGEAEQAISDFKRIVSQISTVSKQDPKKPLKSDSLRALNLGLLSFEIAYDFDTLQSLVDLCMNHL